MLDVKFQKEIKSILFFALEYGIKHVEINKNKKPPIELIGKVHKGFMKAQNLIIQNLLILGKEKRKLKDRLKVSRRNRETNLIKTLEDKIKSIEYKESIIRKIADSIAWTILNFDSTKVKRLFLNNPQVEVYNSNLSHEIRVVEDIFQNNEFNFALLTDITSFIQIADLMILDSESKSIGFAELKEGRINEEISNTLDLFLKTNCEFALFQTIKDKDDKYIKQMKRFINQEVKNTEVVKTINSGEGKDIATGYNVFISEEVFEPVFFENTVRDMLKEVQKKKFALRSIDDCLIIGVYNTKDIPIHTAFEGWKKSCGIGFPTIDFKVFLNDPTAKPMFLCDFSINDKVKILSGEIYILMSLDFNKWISMLKKANINVRLLTKKETERINKVPDIIKPFEYNGQAIQIEYEGGVETLGGGIFEKMFNQFFRPTSIIEFIKFKEKVLENRPIKL
ncbi:hypothetical protein [Sporosarcina sp. Marseille-Q4943]|uniref:hypothetical protein n=1 Tax=Sporosarcina sp. Marseille-Q4943 TaxID=2942204 RepID=UPI00208DC123|nr:hypothetical protein [Sporosarcina sp. Marseille-Q4943]